MGRFFAGNILEIALPKGNPGEVTGLDDFAEPGLKLAVCDLEVPCGNTATQVFEKAGVDPRIDSFEPDVKSVLTKVELGEVDAGLVYHSDVLAAGDRIESIPIPNEFEVVNTYPIVAVKESSNPDGAGEFIDLVMSADGTAEQGDGDGETGHERTEREVALDGVDGTVDHRAVEAEQETAHGRRDGHGDDFRGVCGRWLGHRETPG